MNTITPRLRRLTKEGSWIVIGQIVSAAGALVLVRVLTEYLVPAQYGELALGLTIAGLVNQVVMGGVVNGISRFYSIAAEKGDLWSYLKASRRLMGYATLVVAVLAMALMAALVWSGQTQWLGLAAAVLVFSVLSGFNSSLSGVQNAARQRSIVALHSGMDAWLKIPLVVGVILWLGTTSTAVVIGYTCSIMLVTASQLLFLRRTIPLQQTHTADHQPWVCQIWAYSWPFSSWGIFTWAQQISDRWALGVFATLEEVGMYSVLSQTSYAPIAMASGLLMNFLSPILFQRVGDATDHARIDNIQRLTKQIVLFCLFLTMVAFLLSLLLHKWLFKILVNEQYQDISYLMPWMMLAGGFMSGHHILGSRVSSVLKTRALVRPQIMMALLAVAFNIIGALMAGLVGVVISFVSFSVLYFIWMLWFSNKIIRGMTR